MKIYPSAMIIMVALCLVTACEKETLPPLKLWYNQPAEEWTDALPVGNGRLGAMVFGKTTTEQIQLNEESLWAGSPINNNNPAAREHLPEIRQLLLEGKINRAMELSNRYLLGTPPRIRSYQTLGDLYIDFGDASPVEQYRRELDLRTGIARTAYQQQGVKYIRDVFVSAPDNVLVMQIRAEGGRINARLKLKREKDALTVARNQGLLMTGQIMDPDDPLSGKGGAHMRFAAELKAKSTGGKVVASGDSLVITGASSLLLLFTAATDYNRDMLGMDASVDPSLRCGQILEPAIHKSYQQLQKDHISDHTGLFNRVEFSLCAETEDTLPTDQRLRRVMEGKEDLHLTELYFQYGRYLLMGSSRAPGVLPANLQGIWNHHMEAPWSSDFHTNINLQMNYWPADVCNLPETMDPLTGFMEKITVPGSKTASEMYDCRGWTLHHLTDPFGRTGLMDGIQWGTFPMAGPWMALHFWEHFTFTADTAWLCERAWPVLKGSARFVLDFLIEDKKGNLVTAPSYSPENAYLLPGTQTQMQLTYGATMDIQIARELFNVCLEASRITGASGTFRDSLQQAIHKLPATRIGKDGTIMEWIEDYAEAEPGHRHVSHLFGLHPGTQISPETPELFIAAVNTIERRLAHGGGHTGWSRAWIINFYARLRDGEKAHTHLQALLGKSTLPNLFDTHPPFQIDGNFGGTAAIAEMLLQSQHGVIQVLPALPAAWKDGSVKGLRVRGNAAIDIYWKDGKLLKLILKPNHHQVYHIRYQDHTLECEAEKGKIYTFGPDLLRM
jgi:alpha-L-fucosidase 2